MEKAKQLLTVATALALGFGLSDDARTADVSPARVRIDPERVLALDIGKHGVTVFAVGERGLIWASESGKAWSAQKTSTTRTLTAIAFGDGGSGVAVGHAASLFRTEDGGKTWLPVVVEAAAGNSLLGVSNLGGSRFVAYGTFGLYLESTDGGKSWSHEPLKIQDTSPASATAAPAAEEDAEFDRHIMKIVRMDKKLLLIGESGTLAESADEGKSWRRIKVPYEGSFFGGVVSQKGSIVIHGMRGNVFRSTDAGATWARISLNTISAVNGGTVLADGRIVLVGNKGLVAVSADDGVSFQTGAAKSGGDIAQAIEAEGGALLVVGASGIRPFDLATLKN